MSIPISEMDIKTLDLNILMLSNRISLLKSRQPMKENQKIVKKLERKLRHMDAVRDFI